MTRGGVRPFAAASRRMPAVPAMPSVPGIRMSMSTTSGAVCCAVVTAAAPSPASPTTRRSGCESMSIAMPRRNSG